MKENLPRALKIMFGHEGGYSNRATDAGGPTKFGVTLNTLRAWRRNKGLQASDVQRLTLDEATDIMHRNYWKPAGCDELPSGIDYAVFDFSVNSGPARAVRFLQELVDVTPDGIVGVQTLAAVDRYVAARAPSSLIVDYCNARLAWLRTLKGPTGWISNGRGWERRITGIDPAGKLAREPGVIGHALAMVHRASDPHAEAIERIEAQQPRLPIDDAPRPISETDTSPKAMPAPDNPWLKPDALTALIPAVLGPLAAMSEGPVLYTICGLLALLGLVLAYRMVYRIRRGID